MVTVKLCLLFLNPKEKDEIIKTHKPFIAELSDIFVKEKNNKSPIYLTQNILFSMYMKMIKASHLVILSKSL